VALPRRIVRWTKRLLLVLGAVLLTLLAVRVYDLERGPPLEPWHTYVPTELTVEQLEAAGWSDYLRAEQAILEAVRREVTDRLAAEDRVPLNRYFAGSPVHPGNLAEDWNRSYAIEPDGPPRGVVVLLHGLTDSPYSLRHIARRYRELGYVAVAPRLPGHGSVPAGLTKVVWEEWAAATRLAVREARRRVPAPLPLHLVGFSNGGALALQYALDALEDERLARPDRLILISPMIGITAFARFVGLAALPAILPPFAKAAWLSLLPEFNPFKYNSFPVNGARQAHLLTRVLQAQVVRLARGGRLEALPPALTFQSVVDFTVSTRAVISALYVHLPANGSELVLFDLNRASKLGPLLRPAPDAVLTQVLPPPPRPFRTTLVGNADPGSTRVTERVVEAGSTVEQLRPLDLDYPPAVFSLSHVALPFPLTDSLYGLDPDPEESFGVNLGAIATRGEVGALVVSLDALLRMASNPFFPYMLERIEEALGQGRRDAAAALPGPWPRRRASSIAPRPAARRQVGPQRRGDATPAGPRPMGDGSHSD
jgi:alpha-beta hydrolase superfamily lysophospholipase